MKGLMRSLIVIVLGGALAACTPGGEASPTPVVTPSPTVTPTPTPQWTPEEQGAIDGVNHYLEVWTNISENLADPNQSWQPLWDVARDPAVQGAYAVWGIWRDHGYHLVGAPIFTATLVTTGMGDGQGQRYWVYGCYDLHDSHLADAKGNLLNNDGGDRRPTLHLVLSLKNGRQLVLEDNLREGTC